MNAFNRLYFDSLIDNTKQLPPDSNKSDRIFSDYRRNPTLRNAAGWAFSVQYVSDFKQYIDRIVKVKIKSDLLSIHLQKKIGADVELKDYFTGELYDIRNNNGILSTPGTDGVFDSDDDVALGKQCD